MDTVDLLINWMNIFVLTRLVFDIISSIFNFRCKKDVLKRRPATRPISALYKYKEMLIFSSTNLESQLHNLLSKITKPRYFKILIILYIKS